MTQQELAERRKRLKKISCIIDTSLKHAVGLKTDGTVETSGSDRLTDIPQHTRERLGDVWAWEDMTAVSAGYYHTAGLQEDGTVLALGANTDGQCAVSDWTDIVAISAGGHHTAGLRSDGTVVAVGRNWEEQCAVSGWEDIVAISAGGYHTVGVKADGTVVATGYGDGRCAVSDWTDIVIASAGYNHTVGVKSDGTAVAAGRNNEGQCSVSGWEDIVAVSAGYACTVGLKADGSAVIAHHAYQPFAKEDVAKVLDGGMAAISAGQDILGVGRDGYAVSWTFNDDGGISRNGIGWRLFMNADAIEDERIMSGEKKKTQAKQQEEQLKQLKERWKQKEEELKKIHDDEIARQAFEVEREKWRSANRCQYCGGAFRGMFVRKCSQCDNPRDYWHMTEKANRLYNHFETMKVDQPQAPGRKINRLKNNFEKMSLDEMVIASSDLKTEMYMKHSLRQKQLAVNFIFLSIYWCICCSRIDYINNVVDRPAGFFKFIAIPFVLSFFLTIIQKCISACIMLSAKRSKRAFEALVNANLPVWCKIRSIEYNLTTQKVHLETVPVVAMVIFFLCGMAFYVVAIMPDLLSKIGKGKNLDAELLLEYILAICVCMAIGGIYLYLILCFVFGSWDFTAHNTDDIRKSYIKFAKEKYAYPENPIKYVQQERKKLEKEKQCFTDEKQRKAEAKSAQPWEELHGKKVSKLYCYPCMDNQSQEVILFSAEEEKRQEEEKKRQEEIKRKEEEKKRQSSS